MGGTLGPPEALSRLRSRPSPGALVVTLVMLALGACGPTLLPAVSVEDSAALVGTRQVDHPDWE